MEYFEVLLGNDWEKTTSNSGHVQWTPTAASNAPQAPAAHDASRTEPLMMTTADMALKMDPAYAKISQNFLDNPDEFADAYARAWFKLTHRDMGPKACYLGTEVPAEDLIWQDPVPAGTALGEPQIEGLKKMIMGTGLSVSELVTTAWASASTFRSSDRRGGANGARIALAPQKDWAINKASGVAKVISKLKSVQSDFDGNVSLADLIVLGGNAAIEEACGINVPFTSGRGDASQAQTDVDSFAVLEPTFDGFRNYKNTDD